MLTIKWQDGNTWRDFPADDIAHMPVQPAIDLFSGAIPVIIKRGDSYLVNTGELLQSYQRKKAAVSMLAEVQERDELAKYAWA